MILDVHTHTWDPTQHFTARFAKFMMGTRRDQRLDLLVHYGAYRATARDDVTTIVFGGKAKLTGLWVDDGYVADYANRHPETLVGFMSLDPTQDGWHREMHDGHERLGLRGIKLMPMYAGFMPHDRRIDPLWRYAQRNGLPVLLHTGTTTLPQAPLNTTLPRHLDDVAIRFPGVRVILAHLGHPYEGECVAVIRKHANVYADISALHYRPWQLYNSLMLVQEYGVWGKVLFGTDYPFTNVNASIKGLRSLNNQLTGTNLPRLDEQELEQMIFRDSLTMLGLNA
ncbi:MAG: amidohydrolase family protein [Phycisphaeraceae bacterium]|jgi:hypothetical protein|nr:amidohydrolase family protein [Phycisphaeraceae bacterium]